MFRASGVVRGQTGRGGHQQGLYVFQRRIHQRGVCAGFRAGIVDAAGQGHGGNKLIHRAVGFHPDMIFRHPPPVGQTGDALVAATGIKCYSSLPSLVYSTSTPSSSSHTDASLSPAAVFGGCAARRWGCWIFKTGWGACSSCRQSSSSTGRRLSRVAALMAKNGSPCRAQWASISGGRFRPRADRFCSGPQPGGVRAVGENIFPVLPRCR